MYVSWQIALEMAMPHSTIFEPHVIYHVSLFVDALEMAMHTHVLYVRKLALCSNRQF